MIKRGDVVCMRDGSGPWWTVDDVILSEVPPFTATARLVRMTARKEYGDPKSTEYRYVNELQTMLVPPHVLRRKWRRT